MGVLNTHLQKKQWRADNHDTSIRLHLPQQHFGYWSFQKKGPRNYTPKRGAVIIRSPKKGPNLMEAVIWDHNIGNSASTLQLHPIKFEVPSNKDHKIPI